MPTFATQPPGSLNTLPRYIASYNCTQSTVIKNYICWLWDLPFLLGCIWTANTASLWLGWADREIQERWCPLSKILQVGHSLNSDKINRCYIIEVAYIFFITLGICTRATLQDPVAPAVKYQPSVTSWPPGLETSLPAGVWSCLQEWPIGTCTSTATKKIFARI